MLKKVRFKFVALMMSILVAIFIIVGAIITITINANFTRKTDNILNLMLLEETSTLQAQDTISSLRSYLVKQMPDGELVVSFNEELFNETQIKETFNSILEKHQTIPFSGQIDNLYYKVVKTETAETLMVATERSIEKQINQYAIIRIYLILAFTILFLFIIIWIMSYNVTKPIEEILIKQKQFISDASHELKTPIAIISANADALKTETGDTDNEWLNNIKEQTQRMGILINDMLELAKMEETNHTLTTTDFSLSSVVRNVALSFDALAFEKQKSITTVIPPKITYKGNEESVKKLTTILIDNALKYATENTEIICTLDNTSHPILTIYNKTDKIEENLKFKLFERFYRADESRNRSLGGSGLGLSIAKKICDTNKWKIHADIEENKSLTITVIF